MKDFFFHFCCVGFLLFLLIPYQAFLTARSCCEEIFGAAATRAERFLAASRFQQLFLRSGVAGRVYQWGSLPGASQLLNL